MNWAELAGQDPVAFPPRPRHRPARARLVIEKTAAMSGWADRTEAGTGRGLGFAYCRYRDRGALRRRRGGGHCRHRGQGSTTSGASPIAAK